MQPHVEVDENFVRKITQLLSEKLPSKLRIVTLSLFSG